MAELKRDVTSVERVIQIAVLAPDDVNVGTHASVGIRQAVAVTVIYGQVEASAGALREAAIVRTNLAIGKAAVALDEAATRVSKVPADFSSPRVHRNFKEHIRLAGATVSIRS